MSEIRSNRWGKSALTVIVVLVIVAVLGYAYASPWLALRRMKTAADNGDAATLSSYVDYPALRASLKQQLSELIDRRVGADRSNNPLLLFGAAIGQALVGPVVDAYATPDGVAALLNGIPPTGRPGQRPPPATESAEAPANANPAAAQPEPQPQQEPPASSAQSDASRPRSTAGYRSLNQFAVTWQHSANEQRYAAILQRHGLFSWQLAAVELNGPAQ